MAAFEKPSQSAKILSSLEVKAQGAQLLCGQEQDVSISYTAVGEKAGSVDLMYLVSGPAESDSPARNIRRVEATYVLLLLACSCQFSLPWFCTVTSDFHSAGLIQRKHHQSGE